MISQSQRQRVGAAGHREIRAGVIKAEDKLGQADV